MGRIRAGDWDIGGRLESHDGLEAHAWTFDDRILHASYDPDGAGPADTRLFVGVCPYAPKIRRSSLIETSTASSP
jgi:hypothetical protein